MTTEQRSVAGPPARRLASPRWFDGRLALGVLLVLVAVVVGARVFASADHYSQIYVAAQPLVPGERLAASDLRVGQVHFNGQGSSYIAAAGSAPTGYLVTRFVGPGELIPRNALAATSVTTDTRLVTVPVETGHLPDGLGHGNLVDVYVTPKIGAGQAVPNPTRVLAAVPVDSADGGDRGLTGSATQSVVLAVPNDEVTATIHAVESGTIDLVRVPVDAAAAATGAPTLAPASPTPTTSPTSPKPTATAS